MSRMVSHLDACSLLKTAALHIQNNRISFSWIQFIYTFKIIKELQLFALRMQAKEPVQKKKSFCRFYLRGLCVYSSKQCDFSHGVWDLNYDYWKGQQIEYDYHKKKDDVQMNVIKGPRIYKDLYQFQTEKIYTLQQLSEVKSIRSEVRNLMNQQLYQDFYSLLECKHIDTPMTQSFLIREYTRVGFNKILNTPLKFTQIASYLCDLPNSKYFKTVKIIPPHPNKQNIILRKGTPEEITEAYTKEYFKLVSSSDKPIEQSVLKKHLFVAQLPDNVPPLNQVLKDRKITLPEFLAQLAGKETLNIVFEASVENILQETQAYLHDNLSKKIIGWNDLYNHLSKTLKTNNGNILNQVKPHLVLEHNAFLFFPMVQFIYNSKFNSTLFSELKHQPCKCKFQTPFSQEQIFMQTMNFKGELKEGESFDIFSFESLMEYGPHILNSKVLGVDLQGNLRKGGFVEMIQLNNGRNTFLIDIWHMNERGDFEAFWLARKILRNVMINPKVIKIFHDGRHDSVGLHEMIQTCIVNVFDTSACETLISQLQLYRKLWDKQHKQALNDCKNVINQCNNVKTPGLNEILSKYNASHGINKNKDKYHKMWAKGDVSFFMKRPIDPDYRQYCIRDVLDLPEIHDKMIALLSQEEMELAYWISGQYAKYGYLSIMEDQKNQNIQKHN